MAAVSQSLEQQKQTIVAQWTLITLLIHCSSESVCTGLADLPVCISHENLYNITKSPKLTLLSHLTPILVYNMSISLST